MSLPPQLVSVPEDIQLLDYYRGIFDVVYLALNPFFTLPGIHPLDCDYTALVINRSELPDDIDLMAYCDEAGAERARQKRFD